MADAYVKPMQSLLLNQATQLQNGKLVYTGDVRPY